MNMNRPKNPEKVKLTFQIICIMCQGLLFHQISFIRTFQCERNSSLEYFLIYYAKLCMVTFQITVKLPFKCSSSGCSLCSKLPMRTKGRYDQKKRYKKKIAMKGSFKEAILYAATNKGRVVQRSISANLGQLLEKPTELTWI